MGAPEIDIRPLGGLAGGGAAGGANVVAQQTAQTAVTFANANPQTFLTYTMPAWQVGTTYRIRAMGTAPILNDATVRNMIWKVNVNGTKITLDGNFTRAVPVGAAKTATIVINFDLIFRDTTHVMALGQITDTIAAAANNTNLQTGATPVTVIGAGGGALLITLEDSAGATVFDGFTCEGYTIELVKA